MSHRHHEGANPSGASEKQERGPGKGAPLKASTRQSLAESPKPALCLTDILSMRWTLTHVNRASCTVLQLSRSPSSVKLTHYRRSGRRTRAISSSTRRLVPRAVLAETFRMRACSTSAVSERVANRVW